MITKLVAPWLGWQDRRPPAARGWPHLCRPPTRGEASHPPRSALLFVNLASQRQPRLDFANIIFVFPLYLQAILHLVNLASARQPILDFQMLSLYMWCICIALYLLAAALLVSDRHLDIANITNFCCIWTCSPTPGKLDLWQMTTFELQILILYLCYICICIELAALLVTTALGVKNRARWEIKNQN